MNPERTKADAHPCSYGRNDPKMAGMTIKEYAEIQFQAAALQGMMISAGENISPANAAHWANEHAKAMLKECGYVDDENFKNEAPTGKKPMKGDEFYVLVAERDRYVPCKDARPIVLEQCIDNGDASLSSIKLRQEQLGNKFGRTKIARLDFIDE